MVKVKYNLEKKEWEVLPPYSKEGIYLDANLKKKLDNVKKIMKKEWDAVILLDGIEGSGKSTLSLLCGYYISDTQLTLNNICEGTESAVKKLESLPNGSVLIIDEGSLMFLSTEVMRKEQRTLIKILNVIRQKCMCLIVVAPSFFNLNKYISIARSRFLLHVYTDEKLNRGRFAYFGENIKQKLYILGKKNFNSYAKPRAEFIGRFMKFEPPFYQEYLKQKQKTLLIALDSDEKLTEREIKGKCWKEIVKNLNTINPPLLQKQKAQLCGLSKVSIWQYTKEIKD